MARHLLIGNDVAVAYDANGLLADGALDVQKLSSDGPTSLVPGDTIAESDQIRIVQGGPSDIDVNIVSPWIYGRDVVAWGGQTYAAQTPEINTITITGPSTEAGTLHIKLINKSNGAEPFQIKNYDVAVGSADAQNTIAGAINTAINADLPSWITTCAVAANVVTLTGQVKDANNEYGTIFDIAEEDVATADGTSINGVTVTVAQTQEYTPGVGDGHFIRKMEEDNRGVQYGFYNRVELPNTPAASSVLTDNYDIYHIVATKDGSSASQIHGVDNLIEIYIAFDRADALGTGAVKADLENKLNGYLVSAGFGVVNI